MGGREFFIIDVNVDLIVIHYLKQNFGQITGYPFMFHYVIFH